MIETLHLKLYKHTIDITKMSVLNSSATAIALVIALKAYMMAVDVIDTLNSVSRYIENLSIPD